MWTLAWETATQHGSVALLRDSDCVATQALGPRHYAAALASALRALLAQQGLGLGDVELLAVANGPGSFTGVRVGLATAKALMETRAAPVLAVSTLAAIAEAAAAGPALAVLDAGRGEVYWGLYPSGDEGLESSSDLERRLAHWQGDAVTPDAALAARHSRLRSLDPVLASAVGRLALRTWQAHGDAACASALTLDAKYLGARWER